MTDETEEEQKIEKVRIAISNWKKTVLFPKLNNGIDVNTVIRDADQLRKEIAKILHGNVESIPKSDILSQILDILGDPKNWSLLLKIHMRSVLQTDLFEYPLTINADLIDVHNERKIAEENREKENGLAMR